jgi:hypothetical protein
MPQWEIGWSKVQEVILPNFFFFKIVSGKKIWQHKNGTN